VHERLRLEDTIETLGRASEEAVSLVEQVHSLVTEGNEVRARLASMPPSGLDEEDEGKLARLEESLVEQLTQYGFTSVPPASIGVSRDSYLPAREGYDL
jgi:hypothetical protein